MKKVNIFLFGIGMLSVIGGALAFKAQHRFFGGALVCYTTFNPISPTFIAGVRYTSFAFGDILLCTEPGQKYVFQRVWVRL